MATITNISGRWRGDDLEFILAFPTASIPSGGVAGWTTELKIAATKGGVAVLTVAGTVTNGPAGEFTCSVPAADSILLGSALYYWDFRRTDSGSRDTLGAGTARFDAPNT